MGLRLWGDVGRDASILHEGEIWWFKVCPEIDNLSKGGASFPSP